MNRSFVHRLVLILDWREIKAVQPLFHISLNNNQAITEIIIRKLEVRPIRLSAY
jgi:hypothetical protein